MKIKEKIQCPMVSRLINSFIDVVGIKINFDISEYTDELFRIEISYKKRFVSIIGIHSNRLELFKRLDNKKGIVYEGSIILSHDSTTPVDLYGLRDGYDVICKYFDIFTELSDNDICVYERETCEYSELQSDVKNPLGKKVSGSRMKPYHLAFAGEGFKCNAATKKSNSGTSDFDKYVNYTYEEYLIGISIRYTYKESNKVDFYYFTFMYGEPAYKIKKTIDESIQYLKSLGHTLIEKSEWKNIIGVTDGSSAETTYYIERKPHNGMKELSDLIWNGKKPKKKQKKHANPRFINKINLKKYLDEYYNDDREFYGIVGACSNTQSSI